VSSKRYAGWVVAVSVLTLLAACGGAHTAAIQPAPTTTAPSTSAPSSSNTTVSPPSAGAGLPPTLQAVRLVNPVTCMRGAGRPTSGVVAPGTQ
jgi:hypothetical protein